MSIDLNELKDEAEKLNRLLQDPQPGLLSWNSFLNKRLEKIASLCSDCIGPINATQKVRYVSISVIFVRPVLNAIFQAGGEVIAVWPPEFDRRLCPIWFKSALDEAAILSLALPAIREELLKKEAGLPLNDPLPAELAERFQDIDTRLQSL